MSVSLLVSGYLAGIALRGGVERDAVEAQSKLELTARAAGAHATRTLTIGAPPEATEDLDAGGWFERGGVRAIAEAHVIRVGPGDHGGGAVFAAVRAHGVELGGDLLWLDGARHAEAIAHLDLCASRRLAIAATALITTGGHVSAGGDVTVRPSRRVAITAEVLGGARELALLAHGQLLESTSGVQRTSIKATATLALAGDRQLFVAGLARDASTPDGDRVVITAVLAGAVLPF
ncbi:MAG TPA: hypothetical protein VL463_29075 [Kofleriaceae bacterium]|nr:hypothetical protein [Kofleriaceae bacterium]